MRAPATIVVALALVFASLAGGCRKGSLGGGNGGSSPEPRPSDSAAAAASRGLTDFKAAVDARNARALGFEKPEDAQRAQLGAPMRVLVLGLDTLRAEVGPDAGVAPEAIKDIRRQLFPVMVDNAAVSSLFVAQKDDGWRTVAFGEASLGRALARYRQGPEDFVVWVPALKRYFTARRAAGTVTLTPIVDDPALDVRAGQSVSLDRAVIALRRVAAEYNGLPQ
jgi:hypothetical protein